MRISILNETRQTRVASQVEVADSVLKRGRGLMFQAALAPGDGLWLSPCRAIHTCFVRFPIDVVFISRDLKVVHLVAGMEPWRFSPIVAKALSVLELTAGAIASSRTEVGDQLLRE